MSSHDVAKAVRLNMFRYSSEGREVTYILGSKCKDGVILIGDRKVTLEGGTDYDYQDKFFMDIGPVIVGSSGVLGLFEKFRNRVRAYVATHKNVVVDDFIVELERHTRELNESYRDVLRGQVFDVLIGIKTQDVGAVLQYILPIGFAEPVRKYRAIGHGEPYGSIFLKKLWRPEMTMEEVAELGYFIIKYIDKFELDSSVGVGSAYPQIWFIPNNAPPQDESDKEKQKYNPHQADQSFLEKLESNTQKRLEKYATSLQEDFMLQSTP